IDAKRSSPQQQRGRTKTGNIGWHSSDSDASRGHQLSREGVFSTASRRSRPTPEINGSFRRVVIGKIDPIFRSSFERPAAGRLCHTANKVVISSVLCLIRGFIL